MMKKILLVLLCAITCLNVTGQIVTTIAGGTFGHGGYWGDGGPATAAEFSSTGFIVVDKMGNVYVADPGNYRIRKIDAITNIVTSIAGDGTLGYSPDGTIATAAHFKYPAGVCIDSKGNIYITDCNDYRIRKVDAITNIISTYAGTGIQGYSGDGGSATSAKINASGFTCVDNKGNMYFGDNHRVRKIDATGIITTVAGTGLPGSTGDGVPATSTNIFEAGIGTDAIGNVYVADTTGAIRKIEISTGIITRVAGTGDNITNPYSGGGIATSCHIGPLGITVDPSGNIYCADQANSRVEIINTSGIITSIAGTGAMGFSGDSGPATAATFNYIEHVGIDNCGNVYIADFANRRIRKVTYPFIIPSISLTGIVTPSAGTTVTVTATVAGAGSSYLVHWMNKGVEFAATTTPSVTYTKAAGIDTITARVVSTATYGCYDSTTSAPHIVKVPTVGVTSPQPSPKEREVLRIYPNPVTNVINIGGLQSDMHYRLLNMVGSVVMEGIVDNGRSVVNVKNVANGVYMLDLTDDEGRRTVSKIVKR
ncbi:MAG: C-terminal target protein [Flavipsychrobacter sp.]|nr:C-terminal target protein [Flavipsychrobacter sp.]